MVIRRLLFVLLSTVVVVFFSEKAFWYVQGYALLELLLVYAFPMYVTLRAIDHFRVRRLRGVVLVGALFGFLVEGVLTPVLFEGGLFNPIMPGYFVGWHGFLSVVFGWYLLRKWLTGGRWLPILAGSTLFGLFWGLWSLTYWLPGSTEGYGSGMWSVEAYGVYGLTFTGLLMASHYLLGRGGWQRAFHWNRPEALVVGGGLLFFYVTLSFPGAPLGFITLFFLLALIFLPLQLNRRRRLNEPTALSVLDGPVRVPHLLGLLAMPLAATAVYAAAGAIAPTFEQLRAIQELIPLAQSAGGIAIFLWAWGATLFANLRAHPLRHLPPNA